MKNKRNGLILLAIVLVLALGVGYAAATDTINIGGTAAAVADDFSIAFDTGHIAVTNKTDTSIAVSASYTSADIAAMTVSGLQSAGDYGSAIFKVNNASAALSAKNIATTVTGPATSNTHFTIAVTYSTTVDGTYSAIAPTSVAANSSFYVKVTVTLNSVTADAITAQAFNVEITAEASE